MHNAATMADSNPAAATELFGADGALKPGFLLGNSELYGILGNHQSLIETYNFCRYSLVGNGFHQSILYRQVFNP